MTVARAALLGWYRDATQKLIDAAPTPQNGDLFNSEVAAMNDLLRRQAISLRRLHIIMTKKTTETSGVDRDLLSQRLEDLASISMSKFYAYRFDLLPHHWRQIYTDTLILTTFYDILTSLEQREWLQDEDLDRVVEKLDRAIITAGGAGVLGTAWIEKTLQLLEQLDKDVGSQVPNEPPRKRMKGPNEFFSSEEPHGRPQLSTDKSCPRHKGWSLVRFETYMNDSTPPRPVIFTDLVSSWPALTTNPWKSQDYLLSQTFQGRRLVPVEVGRSYVDQDWGQEIIPFKQFLSKYVEPTSTQVGYLAQHNLFHQIPSLRNDIAIPDFCWSSVPGHPVDETRNQAPLDVPLLNAWFGPARTITPLHTDGYHNLLVQVVGTKYVRLYPPGTNMRPRGVEDGVDMSNTSLVDVGVLEGWDEPDGDLALNVEDMRRELQGTEYWECILGEGDALLIPMGWWHYVRSLSVSFSVSFWWN